ncbi:MAG: ankyrin repeat domain-containing protein [Deltaproteobacteria bacterium]|nr:ankyrin repeat domain-containing protein [Deltaproteobacteria bacterium]
MKHRNPRASSLAVALSALLLAAGAFLLACDTYEPTPEESAEATRTLRSESFWELATVSDVRELLKKGADVRARNTGDEAPLHWAAVYADAKAVKVLLKAGADPKAKDSIDRTPLHKAAYRGHAEVVKVLIEAGADLKAKAVGDGTPLHAAARNGHAEVVKVLIEAGADPKAKIKSGGYRGKTPRDLAEKWGYKETAEILRGAGG